MRKTPGQFFRETVLVHESSRHSTDRRDTGNFVGSRLVGSKYGVTGAALAAYRGVPASQITFDEMARLTEVEAIEVGLKGYYRTNGIDLMPWDVVMASVVDHGFNAGPRRAVEILQRLIGVTADGQAGPKTREAYQQWLCGLTMAKAMQEYTDARIRFYASLNRPEYIKGWTNRAMSFRAGTPWWKANA